MGMMADGGTGVARRSAVQFIAIFAIYDQCATPSGFWRRAVD
jgi:hypothetical protein